MSLHGEIGESVAGEKATEQASQDFWSETDPAINVYQADMTTLSFSGNPITSKEQGAANDK